MKITAVLAVLSLVSILHGVILPLESPKFTAEWLVQLIQYIDRTSEGTLDVMFDSSPAIDSSIRQVFNQARIRLGQIQVTKYESTKIVSRSTARNKNLYVVDGTDVKVLERTVSSLMSVFWRSQCNAPNRRSLSLAKKPFAHVVVVINSPITQVHSTVLQKLLSCHKILVQLSNDDDSPSFYRLSSGDHRLHPISSNSSLQQLLDDRHDYDHYEVRILTPGTRPPYAMLLNGKLAGLDVEVCTAIFNHAKMRHQFVHFVFGTSFLKYRSTVLRGLTNGSIDLYVSHSSIDDPKVDALQLRDKDGTCLMLPKSLERNFVYHLVHPFELSTWLVVGFVIVLDLVLCRFFAEAFPHNLVLILLFGDSLADHEQTRPTRFYCFACTVFLFLLSEAYLAKAIIYMTVTRYTPEMSTLEEFAASGIPLKIGAGAKAYLRAEGFPESVLDRTVEDPNYSLDLDNDQFGHVMLCNYGEHRIDFKIAQDYVKLGRKQTKRKFYLLKQMVDWDWSYYVVSKSFLYYGRLQLAVSWLQESGLWDKWKADYKKRVGHNVHYELWDDDDILALEDILAIWYLTAVGWAISGGVFLLEMVWFYLLKGKNSGFARYRKTVKKN